MPELPHASRGLRARGGAAQLNHDFVYTGTGRRATSYVRWTHHDVTTPLGDPANQPVMPDPMDITAAARPAARGRICTRTARNATARGWTPS